MKTSFDVVIAGAGVVGATLACLLAGDPRTRSLSVAILDTHSPKDFTLGAPVGLRVSALSRASQRILDAAGAWPAIAAARACPYREMRVWDALPDGSDDAYRDGVHFDCAELGEADLGHIVENDLVLSVLHAALRKCVGLNVMVPVRMTGVTRDGEALQVGLDSGEVLHTRLLVGCDGASSPTREFAELEAETASYRQRGVVAVVQTSRPHRETAWQRFLPGGPVAFLPLASGESSIVWSCDEDRALALMELGDGEFSAAVGEASNGVLGKIKVRSRRASFPLRRLHALNYCAAGIVLAGDAAHVVHPLAGQGANLGLLDAASLAEVLGAALAAGEGPGDLRVLRRYERWRKGDNLASLRALDGISQLFSNDIGVLAGIRRRGLRAVNATPMLKNRFMRHALGLAGELPRIARGNTTTQAADGTGVSGSPRA